MTSWTGAAPRKAEAAIAKNYLAAPELEALNRRPMYMADWIAKLADFLRLSERQILQHAGTVSHDNAVAKAELEFGLFSAQRASAPSPAEKHFEDAIRKVKSLEKKRSQGSKRRGKT